VGWAALWLAPRGRAGAAREPARAAVWLQRWVLFKLMFCSGAVKIQARGDASRRPALTNVRPAELSRERCKAKLPETLPLCISTMGSRSRT